MSKQLFRTAANIPTRKKKTIMNMILLRSTLELIRPIKLRWSLLVIRVSRYTMEDCVSELDDRDLCRMYSMPTGIKIRAYICILVLSVY